VREDILVVEEDVLHLRVWSLLPCGQQRLGKYLDRLEIGHFAGDNCVHVLTRSPNHQRGVGAMRAKSSMLLAIGKRTCALRCSTGQSYHANATNTRRPRSGGKCTNGLRSTTRGMVAQRFSPALELMAADCRFVRISLPLRASSYWRLQGTLVGVQVLEDAADRKSGPFICVKPVLILQRFHLP
jgi:hypothetical protein